MRNFFYALIALLNPILLSAQTFNVGEKVNVFYAPDNKWYDAEIITINEDNTYKVHYFIDNTHQNFVPISKIKKQSAYNNNSESRTIKNSIPTQNNNTQLPNNENHSNSISEVCITETEQELINYINSKRQELGLNSLTLSKTLMITANKNVQESLINSFETFEPKHLFRYVGEIANLKYTTTSNTAEYIWHSLKNKSKYDNRYSVLFNDDEYKNKQWNAIGICVRPKQDPKYGAMSSLCIIVGTSKEENLKANICADNNALFTANAIKLVKLPSYPVLALSADKPFSYKVYTIDKNNKREVYYDGNERANAVKYFPLSAHTASYNKEKGIKKYIVSIIGPPAILLNKWKWHEFEIDATRLDTIRENKILFPGNSIAEIDEYLKTNDINSPDKWNVKDENAKGQTYTMQKQESMLHRAALQNNLPVAEHLLRKGASFYVLTNFNEDVFDFCKSDEMFNLLMSFKPDISKLNKNKSWLSIFANYGIYEGVKYMIETQGLPPDFQSKEDKMFGKTPLSNAVSGYNNHQMRVLYPDERELFTKIERVMEFLLSKGANPNFKFNEFYDIPLFCALQNQHLGAIKILIKYNADIHIKDENGSTLLQKINGSENDQKNKEIINYLKSVGVK